MTSPQDPWQQQYPQAPYQQAGLAQMPPASPAARREMGASDKPPATVNAAFWTAIIVPVLYTVLVAVTMLLLMSWLNEATAQVDTSAGQESLQDVKTGMVVIFGFVTFFSAALTGVWILFGFKMRAGRNWARITLTVLAALWSMGSLYWTIWITVLYSAPELPIPASLFATGYAAIGVALIGLSMFVALSYLKPSNWYFKAMAHG